MNTIQELELAIGEWADEIGASEGVLFLPPGKSGKILKDIIDRYDLAKETADKLLFETLKKWVGGEPVNQ